VAAQNTGLSRARGRYIARMDADDVCEPDRLRRQLARMSRLPRTDVVGTAVRMFPAARVSRTMQSYLDWQNRLLTHRAIVRNLLVESPLTHATALFRREALEAVGGWREVDGPEDLDLWLRGAGAGWRFGKVNRVLYRWREHPDRVTRVDPRLGRDRFRALAIGACAAWIGPARPVRLWGWGDSLRDWAEGLRAHGRAVSEAEVNPRAVRGGERLPRLPAPTAVTAPLPGAAGPDGGGEAWVLTYGTAASRTTMGRALHRRGFREGIHFAFAS
jgi:glycosyltransferase involved in cell wall biosynthesis